MQTILCEKPDAAKKFVNALGGVTGHSAKVGTGEPYRIVHAVGHLFELKPLDQMVDPSLKDEFTSWAIKDLPFDHNQIRFQLQIKQDNRSKTPKPSEYHLKLYKEIAQSVSQSDSVIIATDVDPSGEGDLLAWEIINATGFKGKVYRAYMIDDTAPKIRECLLPEKIKEVTFADPIVQSALARQKFDFFTIQYTRATTSLSQDNSVLPSASIVREGRLKSAMTSLVGKREEEYDTFKPSSEYELAYFDSDKRKFVKPNQERFKTPALAMQSNQQKYPDTSTVKFIKKEDKQITPPGLYDLMKLSGVIASRGHDTSTFMDTYQKMYEAHYVTYPRTEDKIITPDQLAEFKQVLPKIVSLLNIDSSLINPDSFASKNLYNPKGKSKAPSHGANRPGSNVPPTLEMLTQFGPLGPVIYEICARQILASFGSNKVNEVSTYSDASSEFLHRVVENKLPGWTLILQDTSDDEDDKDKDDSTSHPTVGAPLTLATNEIKAKRPSLYTENTLGEALAKYNIGTGATRKNTLDDILYSKPSRKLVKKQGARLRLAPLGQLSFVLMNETLLADIMFTQNLNTFLEKIRQGEASLSQTNQLFDRMIKNDLPKIKTNVKFLSTFPKVKSKAMFPKASHTYEPTGELISFAQGAFDHAYTEEDLKTLLSGGTIDIPTKSKKNVAYIAVGKLENNPTYGWGLQIVDRKFAPRKQHTGILKATGEEITFDAQLGQYEFTPSECQALLDGKSISVSGTSKAKKPFTMDLTLQFLPPYNNPTGEKIWQAAAKSGGAREQHTQNFTPTNEQVSIPKVFMKHEFSTPELNALFTGEAIVIPTETKDGTKGKHTVAIQVRPNFNKAGKSLQLGFYDDPDGYVSITPPGQSNKVKIKAEFLGHKFNQTELDTLSQGDSVKFPAKSKAGKDYTAEVELVHAIPYNGKTKTWHVAFVPRNR